MSPTPSRSDMPEVAPTVQQDVARLAAVSYTHLTVYSGVPSHVFGMEQIIDIGPMSGKSNVLFWLERRGISATDDLVDRIYQRAKSSDHTLSDAEVKECLPAAVKNS